jgi:hypothetical protein
MTNTATSDSPTSASPVAAPRRARRLNRHQRIERRQARASARARAQSAAAPDDADTFRNQFALRIHQAIGNHKGYWRDCPERGCRRARACLAPRRECSNAPPLPPDPDGRAQERLQRLIGRHVGEAFARVARQEGGG